MKIEIIAESTHTIAVRWSFGAGFREPSMQSRQMLCVYPGGTLFPNPSPTCTIHFKRCLTKQLNLGTKVHIHIYWYVHVRTEIDLKTQFVGKFFWRSKMALLVPLSSASQRWTATKRAFELHQNLTGLALESLNDWNAETICFCTQVTMWKLYAEKKVRIMNEHSKLTTNTVCVFLNTSQLHVSCT